MNVEVGVFKTEFWQPELVRSSFLTQATGKVTIDGLEEVFIAFHYGKTTTIKALYTKIMRRYDLLDDEYGIGFTKRKFKVAEIHPKNFIGLTEETENLRLCYIDAFFQESDELFSVQGMKRALQFSHFCELVHS